MRTKQDKIIDLYLSRDAVTFMRMMHNRKIEQKEWAPILKEYEENLDPKPEDNGIGTFREPKKRTEWKI